MRMSNIHGAVSKVSQNTDWGATTIDLQNKKGSITIFLDLASLRHGIEPLRLIFSVLRAYNNGIHLKKDPAIWRQNIHDGTNFNPTVPSTRFPWGSLISGTGTFDVPTISFLIFISNPLTITPLGTNEAQFGKEKYHRFNRRTSCQNTEGWEDRLWWNLTLQCSKPRIESSLTDSCVSSGLVFWEGTERLANRGDHLDNEGRQEWMHLNTGTSLSFSLLGKVNSKCINKKRCHEAF